MIPESARIKINCVNKNTLNSSMRNKNSNSTGKTIQINTSTNNNNNNNVMNMKINVFNKNLGKPIRLSPSPPRKNETIRSNSQSKRTLNKSISGSNIKNAAMPNGGSKTKSTKTVFGNKTQNGCKTTYHTNSNK
jgi:hypothetical protein